MLPKLHLTSHSMMSGAMWMITPLLLSALLWPFEYSSSCHLSLISSASVRSFSFLFLTVHPCRKYSLSITNFLQGISGLSHSIVYLYFFFTLLIEEGCLQWSAGSLDKILLAIALLHCVLQGQTCLLFWVSLDFLLLHSNPLWWKGYLSSVLAPEEVVCLYQTAQLHSLHQWLGHILGLLWCQIVFLGNELRL